jgi:pyruvate carboxylase subunit A
MRLMGVKTTAPYYAQILANPTFRGGRFDTSFIAKHPELTRYSEKTRPQELALAVATAIAVHTGL